MTAIQWTDVTDNIIVVADGGWWCHKISPGCTFCYAEDLNGKPFFGGNKRKYSGTPPVMKLREDLIDGWARQRKPKKHFVASMTDVFGEWVPQSWIFRFLDGMIAAPRQTFQVLTKRADVALRQVWAYCDARGLDRLPGNIWLGVTVEDQERADERIPHLLRTPVTLRFLSVEPLLGPVRLDQCSPFILDGDESNPGYINAFNAMSWHPRTAMVSPPVDGSNGGIRWVIVGGESGKKARPCDAAWIDSIVAQCKAAGVAYFVKQLGAVPMETEERWRGRVQTRLLSGRNHHKVPAGFVALSPGDPKGGDWTLWPDHLRVREFPKGAA
jgi:protein gp37